MDIKDGGKQRVTGRAIEEGEVGADHRVWQGGERLDPMA